MVRENGLSNDKLKMIAATAMLVDHVGAYLLPQVYDLRVIGRLAFPIFAFMIAEGCRYTKNKKRYLLNMFVLAVVCQVLFFPFKAPTVMRIPVTFTIAIAVVYALQNLKTIIYSQNSVFRKVWATALFLIVIYAVYTLNVYLEIDYGFWGCVTPAIVSVVHWQNGMPQKLKKYDSLYKRLAMLAMALLLIFKQYGGVQIYSLLSLLLLAFYNGRRENTTSKYFFYVFYPLHLAVIYIIQMIIY